MQLCWLFSLYHREEGGRWGCIHTSPWISENIKLQSLVIQFVQGGRGRDVIEGGRWGCFNTSPWISENIKVKLLAIQSAPEGGGRDVSRRRALRMFSYFALNLRDHHIGYADVRVEVFFIITTMPETCGRCDVRGATFCGHPFRKWKHIYEFKFTRIEWFKTSTIRHISECYLFHKSLFCNII